MPELRRLRARTKIGWFRYLAPRERLRGMIPARLFSLDVGLTVLSRCPCGELRAGPPGIYDALSAPFPTFVLRHIGYFHQVSWRKSRDLRFYQGCNPLVPFWCPSVRDIFAPVSPTASYRLTPDSE